MARGIIRTSRSALVISSTSKKYNSNMLKSVVLCVLVWHGMCQFSSRAHPYFTDTEVMNFTEPVSPNVNDTDVQIVPKVNYNFITIFSVNGSFFGTAALTSRSTTASTSASLTEYRHRYILTNGIGAHRLYTTALTWSQAKQICIEDGGDLAVIRSDAEEEITKKMAIDSGVIGPWIGFLGLPGKRHWACMGDKTTESGKWLSWQGYNPHKNGADHHVYDYNGTLVMTGACYTSRPFICKIPTV